MSRAPGANFSITMSGSAKETLSFPCFNRRSEPNRVSNSRISSDVPFSNFCLAFAAKLKYLFGRRKPIIHAFVGIVYKPLQAMLFR